MCNEEGVLVFSEERLQLVGDPAKLTQERPFTEYTYNTEAIKETTKKVVVGIKNSEYLPQGHFQFMELLGQDMTLYTETFNRLLGDSYGARFMAGDQNLAILDDGTVGLTEKVFEWEILKNPLDLDNLLVKAKGLNKYLSYYMDGIAPRFKVVEPDKNGVVKSVMGFYILQDNTPID